MLIDIFNSRSSEAIKLRSIGLANHCRIRNSASVNELEPRKQEIERMFDRTGMADFLLSSFLLLLEVTWASDLSTSWRAE